MKNKIFKLIVVLILLSNFITRAQTGANDSTFNPSDIGFGLGYGASYQVFTTAIQSDGKIIIGGEFTAYNCTNKNYIARLNTDGSLDTSFNTGIGANNIVFTTAIQSDGKIIIGGRFTSYNGTVMNHIARLNTDGSLDSTFNPGTGVNNDVFTTAIQDDGKIIIGGSFTTFNSAAKNYIARLNTNGSLDATFNTGTGPNGSVYTTTKQSNGKIIIGGAFTSYNGTIINYIARLNTDSSIDTSFNTGIGANNIVFTTAIQNDGKIIIGGWFFYYNGTARVRIARLNTDGSLDATFNIGTGLNNTPETIAIQSDGKIIIGGWFTTYNDTARNYIARLNTDGSLDATFNPGTGANYGILTTVIQTDGKIVIGGQFYYFNSLVKRYITRINSDSSLDTTFNSGTGAVDDVFTTSIQNDEKIIIGGIFTTYNGIARNCIARLNIDGNLDTTFNPGMGVNGYVRTTAIQSDGKIIIGGFFTTYNGTAINHIARLNTNGSIDTTFITGMGATDVVWTTAIQSDGKIIIGGLFTSYNGTVINRIARLNTNGNLDTTFITGTGTNSLVRTTAIQSDGKIIIGGNFTSYNGTTINHIARLNSDGSLDTTFNLGTGATDRVLKTAIQSDGKIIIGGNFTSYNGTVINRIARLNTDGSLDTTFNIGTGATDVIWTTAIQSDGKIIIGGDFTTYNGTAINRIARLNTDGSLDTIFNSGTGANYQVVTTAIQSDEKIIIGGGFTSYYGIGRNHIARILNPPTISSVIGTTIICSGSTTTLTANSSAANPVYSWYDALSGGNLLFTGNVFTTPTLTSTVTYYVEVTNGFYTSNPRTTVTVNVNNYTSSLQTFTECAGFSVTVGTNTYNTTGVYNDVLTGSNGCDSIVTTNLTVLPANTFTQSPTVCSGQSITVGSNTYSTSGTYNDVLTSVVNGCDSTITTNLTVLIEITDSVEIIPATCGSNNGSVSVTPSGGTGTYTFLWNNGNTTSTITGLSGQPADSLIVTITDTNGCSLIDTAIVSCITGVNENNTGIEFKIFPNPSNGDFIVEYDLKDNKTGTIKAFDTEGRILSEQQLKSGCNQIIMPASTWSSQLILCKVFVEGKQVLVEKVVKE